MPKITCIYVISLTLVFAGCSSVTRSQSAKEVQNGLRLVIEVQTTPSVPKVSEKDLAAVKRVVENRIQRMGISPATVKIQGENQILLLLSGVKDSKQVTRVLVGGGKLEMKEQKIGTENQFSSLLANGSQLIEEQDKLRKNPSLNRNAIAKNTQALQKNNLAISQVFKTTNPPLTSNNIKDAFSQKQTQDDFLRTVIPQSNQPIQGNDKWEIAIKFDEQGSRTFAQLTKSLAGTGRGIGIFIDDKLISHPVVGVEYAKNGITGGSAVITGNFTAEKAKNIALQLPTGTLPLPLKMIESTSIKPVK
ncbi:MAG: hypothetical protein HC903_08240 [Methylacidiphilales bacterium]|nr:hypothetical protein [Candidatus Methylacidiphilales bacterium]